MSPTTVDLIKYARAKIGCKLPIYCYWCTFSLLSQNIDSGCILAKWAPDNRKLPIKLLVAV